MKLSNERLFRFNVKQSKLIIDDKSTSDHEYIIHSKKEMKMFNWSAKSTQGCFSSLRFA